MRNPTVPVRVGKAVIGGSAPILVQSMTTTKTSDLRGSVQQILDLAGAGCELVRITTPTLKDAQGLEALVEQVRAAGVTIPLSADIHFQPRAAFEALKWVEKVRINPGNFAEGAAASSTASIADVFGPFVEEAKNRGRALRIGVNHGSLSKRMLTKFGDTPEGMVQSALEYLEVCEALNFDQIVFSLKASNPHVAVAANRLMVQRLKERAGERGGKLYPMHLGVTEAGEGEDGRIKSAVGIGSLLLDGIGDTIRVSLTEDPVNEIPVAFAILQSAGARRSKAEFISCPGCGRTLFDLQSATKKVKARLGHLKELSIAVMGCIVNGPGEMAGADFGYVGGAPGHITLYEGSEPVQKNIPEAEALDALVELIKSRGKWTEKVEA
jgi:(E)-4-hydroxy-3-methylbut-2-enyl-diphosphate synthase